MMIEDVPLVGVFDQDAALAFYTEKLGLVKARDEPCDEGALGHGLARGGESRGRPQKGQEGAREGDGGPLRRSPRADARHRRRGGGLRAAAGVGRAVPGRPPQLPRGRCSWTRTATRSSCGKRWTRSDLETRLPRRGK